MPSYDFFMNVILVTSGVYLIYSAIQMKLKGEVSSWLVGKGVDLSKARDLPGFITYMWPIILGSGILVVLFGIASFFVNEINTINKNLFSILTIVVILLIVGLAVVYNNAKKKFLV